MDEERRRLKEDVIRADRGPFIGWWDALLRHDPAALRRVHELLSSAEAGQAVSESLRHLIWTAVDAVVTHLFPRGIGVHAEVAIVHGATARQVIEALEVASSVCSRGFRFGLPIILEALGETTSPNLSGEQAAAKERLRAKLGYWSDWMDAALVTAPDYLERLVTLGAGDTSEEQGLDQKSKALIAFACAVCPALVDQEAAAEHCRRAVSFGATKDELVQVLQLANCIGLHSLSTGISAFDERPAITRQVAAE